MAGGGDEERATGEEMRLMRSKKFSLLSILSYIGFVFVFCGDVVDALLTPLCNLLPVLHAMFAVMSAMR